MKYALLLLAIALLVVPTANAKSIMLRKTPENVYQYSVDYGPMGGIGNDAKYLRKEIIDNDSAVAELDRYRSDRANMWIFEAAGIVVVGLGAAVFTAGIVASAENERGGSLAILASVPMAAMGVGVIMLSHRSRNLAEKHLIRAVDIYNGKILTLGLDYSITNIGKSNYGAYLGVTLGF